MKFNEGVSQADFDTILRIAKEIGVETGADLDRFKREQVKDGESLVDAFLRYRAELGDDFKIEESLEEAWYDEYLPLEYPNLEVEQSLRVPYGTEPDSKTVHVSYTYNAPREEVEELLADACIDDDLCEPDDAYDYVDEHLDDLMVKYEKMLLDHFEEDAIDSLYDEGIDWDDDDGPDRYDDYYESVESESATPLDENWCDDALAELEQKPRDQWTEEDWNTYNYCKNANAERDWQDAQDDDDDLSDLDVFL